MIFWLVLYWKKCQNYVSVSEVPIQFRSIWVTVWYVFQITVCSNNLNSNPISSKIFPILWNNHMQLYRSKERKSSLCLVAEKSLGADHYYVFVIPVRLTKFYDLSYDFTTECINFQILRVICSVEVLPTSSH